MATRVEHKNHVIEIRQEDSPGRGWRKSVQTVYDIFRRAGGALLPVLAGFEQGRGPTDQAALAARLRARVDRMLLEETVRPGMLRNQGTPTKRYQSTIDPRKSPPYNGRR